MNEINKALEALKRARSHYAEGHSAVDMVLCMDEAIATLCKASALDPAGQCGESCERAKLCGACARGLEEGQEPVALTDAAEALREVVAAYDHHQTNVAAGLGIVSGGKLALAIEAGRAALAASQHAPVVVAWDRNRRTNKGEPA